MNKKYAVMDGNTAAAHVAYAFTEVSGDLPDHAVFADGRKGG